MLTPEERQRVSRVLGFGRDDDQNVGDLVEQLQTPEELHQFVMHYNPNDGLLPLWWVVRNPDSDRGTALYTYWQLADCAFDREAFRGESDPNWDGVGLIEEIERRYIAGYYTRSEIRVVPLERLGLSPVNIRLMKHRNGGQLPFPEVFLEPTPGDVVERDP